MFFKVSVERCKLLFRKVQVPFPIFTRATFFQFQLSDCDFILGLVIIQNLQPLKLIQISEQFQGALD
jgi:hypothetical protein